ncbi:MAG TPA: hypothetical protein DCE42_29225 [Myxococcales bacterium]|nr:hypothetical protein [Deltaproteobacteria bacterium]MBU53474.1 hypothetical protein [Deltaproteobacteria bacterium]HAA58881.1 hypothetical protein [Myxococcales bacterium]|tara:strand:+ start:3716 stop:4138 length:423 start_codon:yes stop_codon:yes gene_type:complete
MVVRFVSQHPAIIASNVARELFEALSDIYVEFERTKRYKAELASALFEFECALEQFLLCIKSNTAQVEIICDMLMSTPPGETQDILVASLLSIRNQEDNYFEERRSPRFEERRSPRFASRRSERADNRRSPRSRRSRSAR